LYDPYYFAWSRTVQGTPVAHRLQDHSVAAALDKALLNGYTIIELNDEEKFTHVPYAIYFSAFLQPIADLLQHLIEKLESIHQNGTSSLPQHVQKSYIIYLQQYKTALLATNDLEAVWEELDMKWMDVKHTIQIVHDIESGYGDPLRVKVIPDFSLRFVDETYAEANQTMSQIQDHMINYFKSRETSLCKAGLSALSNCMSAIYYIPFQAGMSLHFRFSGQSIPNRANVKEAKGVKLFFDPVSTNIRLGTTRSLAAKVMSPEQLPKLTSVLDAVDTIVYQVAAHEIGHSIYGLHALADILHPSTPALLEEPRAELTTLFTLNLLFKNKFISLERAQNALISFVIQDLRRFASFDAAATRPYTISAISTYNTALEKHFLVWDRDHDILSVDYSKTLDLLGEFSSFFEQILQAEDDKAADKIEKALHDMQLESDLTRWLVAKLKN